MSGFILFCAVIFLVGFYHELSNQGESLSEINMAVVLVIIPLGFIIIPHLFLMYGFALIIANVAFWALLNHPIVVLTGCWCYLAASCHDYVIKYFNQRRILYPDENDNPKALSNPWDEVREDDERIVPGSIEYDVPTFQVNGIW
jgi:hypothetical protein